MLRMRQEFTQRLQGMHERTLAKHSKARKRIAAAKLRKKRILKVKRQLPGRSSRVSRIFTTAVRPAVAYGTRVNGASDAELLEARRLMLSATPPYARGTSLTAKLVLSGDPAWEMSCGPLLAWHDEAWRAARHDLHSLTLAQMNAAWRAANPDATSWQTIRGPLQAALLSLQRLQWTAEGPFLWRNDLGYSLRLLSFSPRMFRRMLRQSVQRNHERSMAKKLGAQPTAASLQKSDDPYVAWERAHFGIVTSLLREGSTVLTPLEKGVLRAAAAGAIWTKQRQSQAGYDCGEDCDKCGGPDTVHHRIWTCPDPAATALRSKMPAFLRALARKAGASAAMFTRFCIEHPADLVPPPELDGGVEIPA
ncbi:MAG TPA: hypothetical protein EYP98_04890 [Planctomycetes bacterium]|nr:hypothetical protein [Planctomycetota bacterium]